ncbi:inheritance of peroxisomes protein 1-domain-containing protein [Thelonectria olida]|uniref:Inheritance of peroxisomes protein 1 n=1 Tax=Thelonectria olida TaxID=1576542 RepID=A0A9P9ANI5_9HYPO|nr:inheritance of peroxisomes protein 1-domain-containing protein [Thelonectria olida]
MDDSSLSLPVFRTPRRVATAPISLAESARASSPLVEGIVETLYNHPNAKIISFTVSGRAFSRSTGLPVEDAPGTLSWSSQLERTIAVGPFRIYRAPGSVAFLNCGSALQPILPRSQCWCIDEVNSKFVLQIRRPNYWRIELPVTDPEDQQRAELLRVVFDKILQFEKTECPFKRAFTVELPEPQTPVRKRPWTPVQRSLSSSPAVDADSPDSPASTSRRASFLQRGSTPTPLSFRQRANSLDFSDDPPVSRRASSADPPPIVRTETAKLEAKIEADALDELARAALENNTPLRDWDQYTEFQDANTTPSRTQRDDRDRETQRSILESLLVPSHSSPRTSNFAELHAQFSRAGTLTPELQDEGSSSEDHQEISPRTESSPQGDVSAQDEDMVYELHEGSGNKGDRMKTRLRRTTRFAVARSVTLPPHLKLSMDRSSDSSIMPPTMQADTPRPASPSHADEDMSSSEFEDMIKSPGLRRRGSDDSFHSVKSWRSQSGPPQSPLLSQPNTIDTDPNELTIVKGLVENHARLNGEVSETGNDWETRWVGEGEPFHASMDMVLEDEPPLKMAGAFPVATGPDNGDEAPPAVVRRRRTTTVTSHRPTTSSISVGHRAFQPLPPAANFFNPAPNVERRPLNRLEAIKQIPMAIISKTLGMLLGPPAHLIALMLKVAAKILAGEWRGLVFGYDEEGEEIPVQWDYSEGDFSDWSDDELHASNYPRRQHHRHHSHHRQNSHPKTRGTPDESAAVESSESSSDDSRSWGVD